MLDPDFLDAHLGNAHTSDDEFSVSPDYEFGHVATDDLVVQHGMETHDPTWGLDHDTISQVAHSIGVPGDDLHAIAADHALHEPYGHTPHTDPVVSAQYGHDVHVHNPNAHFEGDGVFESVTGLHLSAETPVSLAREEGWFHDDAGTLPAALGGANEAGSHSHQHYEATLDEIIGALRRGDHVLVALDANEVYRPIHDPGTGEAVEQANAPHTAFVREVQPGPDGSTKIALSHPGSDKTVLVNGEDFLNAWRDYGNLMVTTKTGDA